MITITKAPLGLLHRTNSIHGTRELSGELAFPPEFDLNLYVGNWVLQDEVGQARALQPLQGSVYQAPGWDVWKYPEFSGVETEVDDKGKEKTKPKKHEKAGNQHIVALSGNKKFVLMFRSREVQEQVNEVYARISTERLLNEASGQTVDGAQPQDGILTDQMLTKHLGAEADAESSQGRSTIVKSVLNANETRLKAQTIRVTR